MNPHDPRLKIKRWRWHAQQCRADAESMNPDARGAMLRIAQFDQQMANAAETRLSKPANRRPDTLLNIPAEVWMFPTSAEYFSDRSGKLASQPG